MSGEQPNGLATEERLRRANSELRGRVALLCLLNLCTVTAVCIAWQVWQPWTAASGFLAALTACVVAYWFGVRVRQSRRTEPVVRLPAAAIGEGPAPRLPWRHNPDRPAWHVDVRSVDSYFWIFGCQNGERWEFSATDGRSFHLYELPTLRAAQHAVEQHVGELAAGLRLAARVGAA